jgi:hypothetical protein
MSNDVIARLEAVEALLEEADGLWEYWRTHDITRNDDEWASFSDAVRAHLERRPVPTRFLPPVSAAEAESSDPLHPTGRCRCGGEGRCDWCTAHPAPYQLTEDDGVSNSTRIAIDPYFADGYYVTVEQLRPLLAAVGLALVPVATVKATPQPGFWCPVSADHVCRRTDCIASVCKDGAEGRR